MTLEKITENRWLAQLDRTGNVRRLFPHSELHFTYNVDLDKKFMPVKNFFAFYGDISLVDALRLTEHLYNDKGYRLFMYIISNWKDKASIYCNSGNWNTDGGCFNILGDVTRIMELNGYANIPYLSIEYLNQACNNQISTIITSLLLSCEREIKTTFPEYS